MLAQAAGPKRVTALPFVDPNKDAEVVSEGRDSVAFDRAADYYDRTRGNSPEGLRKTIDLLTGEARDQGLVLEVGVGTGQLGLPLHEAGISMVGLDLARPMMDILVEKAEGRCRSRSCRGTRPGCRSETERSEPRISVGSST